MKNFGLSPKEYEFLEKYLISPLKNKGAQVFIFGSRATGKYSKYSDIDIIYKDINHMINATLIYEIITFFEESSYPYKIDLVNEQELASSYKETVLKNRINL
jgi:predicted nucleotidyltransferase